MQMPRAHRSAAVLALLTMLGACASAPETRDAERNVDPLEGLNRVTYAFNDTADRFILRPIAKGYETVVPSFARTGISNFFDNLRYPIVIVNDILQGKVGQAFADTGRFLMNTTFGLGGLLDPASLEGLEEHDEDFGQTLAVWGVPDGPYVMLPLVGPSTLRDAFGRVPDTALDPLAGENTLIGSLWSYEEASVQDKLLILSIVDARARFLNVDDAIREAYDPYLFVREAYLQRRRFQVYDGEPPLEDDFEDFEDFEDDDPAAAGGR